MDPNDAIKIANAVVLSVAGHPLTDIERHVLCASLEGKSYDEMAQGWSARTLKDAGARLWKYLSQALGGNAKVSKSSFQAALIQLAQDPRYGVSFKNLERPEMEASLPAVQATFKGTAGDVSSREFLGQRCVPQLISPFITGTPILNPRLFFGRQRVLKRLFNLLKTHPLQNAAIIGPRRSGKTSLLNYLRTITTTPSSQLRPGQISNWLPHPETYRWIFVDFQDARRVHRERLLAYLLESMQLSVPTSCTLERFMDLVSDHVSVPTVILMDEIGVGLQRCPELDDSFWESLRALATNQTNGNLAFVLSTPESPMTLAHHAGHGSPFFNIFGYTAKLGPLTEPEARELMQSSPLALSEADMSWIFTHSRGWPLLIQILCQERLYSLEETSDHWQQDGLQQMTPFMHLLE